VTPYAGLAARIDHALRETDALLARIEALAARAPGADDFAVIDALALNLQGLYTGLEHVFEAVAREVDGALPAGPNYHRELLIQMSGAVAGARPPVVTAGSFACLDRLRAFRHIVRNVYSHSLDPRRVMELSRDALSCYAAVRAELRDFGLFLAAPD
jgi:hypothetical protein